MALSRITTALSVRLRLIVLALVPVFGFAAIGLAYMSSEKTVEAAFGSVQQSSRMAGASRAFKEAVTAMQMRAKEFVAQPQPALVARFADAHEAAMDSLKTIQELVSEAERQNLAGLQGRHRDRHPWGQHARRDDGRDRIGRVVEPVDEVEHDGKRDQQDQQRCDARLRHA